MTIKLAVVMDALTTVQVAKDSTVAMLLEAQQRNWQIYYLEQKDLYAENGAVFGMAKQLNINLSSLPWYALKEPQKFLLHDFDVVLMRKDPPFDMEYIYTTQLLELAERAGALVINKPQSLRDANEKLFAQWFPHCCPPTLVARDKTLFRDFIAEHKKIVLKPLEGMGGTSIFLLQENDSNISVVIETLTANGQMFAMAQRYIPDIVHGDKRIIMINGEPIPYALARIPAAGELRGNLAAGATGVGRELTARDRWLCEQVGPVLKEKGLIFVGLDVIGDYITEINVTSPTGIRQLDKIFNINIGAQFLDCAEQLISWQR